MTPLTIQQLDGWMTAHCYNDSYGIGNRIIHEGYGLSASNSLYIWYYIERGERQNLNYFQTEQEAVDFAFRAIIADKSANRHLVGLLNDKSLEQALLAELDTRGIAYWKDEIPYGGLHDRKTRVFVFGCEVQKALDLQKEYSNT